MTPRCMSSTDRDQKLTMSSKSAINIIMIIDDTDKIIQELFDSLSHQKGLEQFRKGRNFVFDYISGMHYIYNKISINRVR